MRAKREITISFVTESPGARVLAAIDAISQITDDLKITVKLLSRGPERPVVRTKRARASPKVSGVNESLTNGPQLVYSADPEAAHNRNIDVDASLKKLGLTREQLVSRRWTRGSPQHRLKRAAAHAAKVEAGANAASRSNGTSRAGR